MAAMITGSKSQNVINTIIGKLQYMALTALELVETYEGCGGLRMEIRSVVVA